MPAQPCQPRVHHLRYHCVTCLCHSLPTFTWLVLSLFVVFSPCESSVLIVGLPVQIWWHQQLLLSTLQFVTWEAKCLCWDHPGCVALPFHAKGQFCAFLSYKDSSWCSVRSPGALREPEAFINFSKYTWADSGLWKSKSKAAIHECNCLFARILQSEFYNHWEFGYYRFSVYKAVHFAGVLLWIYNSTPVWVIFLSFSQLLKKLDKVLTDTLHKV